MRNKKLAIALRSALFLAITGIIAWLLGQPMIFPSLGPTAYVLAFDIQKNYAAKTVVGGHFCGVVGGLTSYYLISNPYQLTMLTEPFSPAGLMLSTGAVVALFLAVLLMLVFNASHPPACATTLIISLGILSGWLEALFIITAVVVMYISYRLYLWLSFT